VRIGLIMNAHRADAVAAAAESARWLRQHGVEVHAEQDAAQMLGVSATADGDIAHTDLVICFGGDGTLIRAAHLCSEFGTPILGVYFGRFGFVTQCEGDEVGAALSLLMDGKAQFESRMMLQTELIRGNSVLATMHSLNETVLQRAATDRMLIVSVVIDDHSVTTYPADGILVATPTGSTAYNLSAGGPIVDPNLQLLVLTAIAPHTLSARPLILKPESRIRLCLETSGDAVLSVDGQTRLHLFTGDEVCVTRSPRVTRLLTVDKDDFLEKLSHRLFYGLSATVERKS
jgi:NAD+ kinase